MPLTATARDGGSACPDSQRGATLSFTHCGDTGVRSALDMAAGLQINEAQSSTQRVQEGLGGGGEGAWVPRQLLSTTLQKVAAEEAGQKPGVAEGPLHRLPSLFRVSQLK